jgi:hypothetical protein
VRDARLFAEGDLDFRGTLGVSRDARIGFTAIRLFVEIDGGLTDDEAATLLRLTERYCVVAHSLKMPPAFARRAARRAGQVTMATSHESN